MRFTKGDLSGGLAAAIMSLGSNVAAGVIAFAPLGPDYVGHAIMAGMLSSIVAGLVASLSGSAPGVIVGPQVTTAMALAALLGQLLVTGQFDARPELLVSLAFAAVLMSAGIQFLFGALRVGGMVSQFIPYPVVSGIQNATAILLVWGQLWTLTGVERLAGEGVLGALGRAQPATVAVALVTGLVAWYGSRYMSRAAVPVAALALGTILYYSIALILPDVGLGGRLPRIEGALPRPDQLGGIVSALGDTMSMGVLGTLLTGALAMAVLDAVITIITLVSYQSYSGHRYPSNKQLIGQGVGSAVSSVFGGLSASAALARSTASLEVGGRNRASGVAYALAVLVLVVVLAEPLSWVPEAAISGLIVTIALRLVDDWSLRQLGEVVRADSRRVSENWIALAQMLFVVVVGLLAGLIAAVGAGVALSVVIFVAEMSRPPIRRIRRGQSTRSVRQRSRKLTEQLDEHRDSIAVVELEGTIFFGSCESLAVRAEQLPDEGAEYVLFDLRRVTAIDATGYRTLGQTYTHLTGRGCQVAFTHVANARLGSEVEENLELNGVPGWEVIESLDRGLEAFEEALLTKLGADASRVSAWTVATFGDTWGLGVEDSAVLGSYLERRRFKSGEVVVEEGDTSRSLFLISRGSAEITISLRRNRRDRVATVQHGTVFGEVAFLDGKPRTARVEATSVLDTFELTREAFDRLEAERPDIAVKIQAMLSETLGTRLRAADRMMLELDF